MPSNEIAHCSFIKDLKEASSSKDMSPKKNTNYLLKRIQRTCEKYQEKPLPPAFKSRLDGPSPTWRIFNRLQMATAYADSRTKDCMIFAFESKISNNGQRLFLVAHPEQVWQNHRSRKLEERCTYEIIRENYPCKLYFDLEYYNAFNYNKDGNAMTKIFIKCVIASMYDQHSLLVKDSDFLWLDASNDSKFSCHLILQIKGVAFQDNIHAGTFVSILISTLRKKIENNTPSEGLWPSAEEIKTLLIKSKKENEVFFCDEGVYSRNRNFRMFLSTKYGKKCPLILSPYNKYWPFGDQNCKEETIFYDSLITYFRGQDIYKILCYEQNHTDVSTYSQKIKNKSGVSGNTSSPFPDLDNFILNIVADDLIVGFIRKWTYYCKEQKIIYDIGNYRYCGNIGRHHKSNNIKIIVDMKAKCYYQICLDPDCRQEGYQSQRITLPEGILSINVPDNFFDEECFSQLQPEKIKLENNNNASFCTEEIFHINTNDSFENNMVEKEDSWKTILQEMAVDNFFDSTSIDDKLCDDWKSSFGDFSELCKINNEAIIARDGNQNCSDKETNVINFDLDQDSWDDFFMEDFTCTENAHEVCQEMCENQNEEDFSFLNDEQSWCSDSAMEDASVSFEEEMLMVEAVEAAEAAMHENIFSEETIF